MSRRVVLATTGSLTTLSLAMLSGARGVSGAPSAASPSPGAPVGPTVLMKSGQAHLTPTAVAGALPTQQASKRAQQEAGLPADRSPDELTAGVFTDDTLTAGPGAARRLLDHRKVYVATFKRVPVIAGGAPVAPGGRAIQRKPGIGTITVIMDARTGAMLEQLTEGD